jgi:DNA polymerase (family X)
MTGPDPYNEWVASRLDEVAGLLTLQEANRFRIDAYARAAETVRGNPRSLDLIVRDEGITGLDRLPGIGHTLARLLYQLVKTGQLPMLDRLRGQLDPLSVLGSVPGIGRKLAADIHEKLGIDSLEELEAAAYDGRLASLGGFGKKRISGIRDSLAARLGRRPRAVVRPLTEGPAVSEILSIDEEYREKAQAGVLHKMAPRRFNPSHDAWLPVLHAVRGDRHYTALFSNTARAHELHKTADWVVIYCDTDHTQRQFTVVTASRGVLEGKRVVRGREAECYEHYRRVFAAFVPPVEVRGRVASGGRS